MSIDLEFTVHFRYDRVFGTTFKMLHKQQEK